MDLNSSTENTLSNLDNPIWSALTTRQAHLALGDEYAKIYPRDMLSMAGIETTDSNCFAALSKLIEPGKKIGLCLTKLPEIPDDWKIAVHFATAQMIRQKPPENFSSCQDEIVKLQESDVVQMQELAELTKPGPFTSKTIQFGNFYGIKIGADEKAKLVAMTGQRMKMTNCTEVSGVCTHPDFQGRGYARSLVHRVALEIESRGEIPFLHVIATNLSAIKSYTSCGFTARRTMQYLIVEKIGFSKR